jgi:hypothetical protein
MGSTGGKNYANEQKEKKGWFKLLPPADPIL